MRQIRTAGMGGGEKTIRDIRRATRRQYSAEEKIRVLGGVAALGRRTRFAAGKSVKPQYPGYNHQQVLRKFGSGRGT